MIYECTDCKHCADFNGGYRLFCLCPSLPPESVCGYHPVGNNDALDCSGFDDDVDYSHWFSWSQLDEAETYSRKHHGEVTYAGIREWCELQLQASAPAQGDER
jgi:hypothetical protein